MVTAPTRGASTVQQPRAFDFNEVTGLLTQIHDDAKKGAAGAAMWTMSVIADASC